MLRIFQGDCRNSEEIQNAMELALRIGECYQNTTSPLPSSEPRLTDYSFELLARNNGLFDLNIYYNNGGGCTGFNPVLQVSNIRIIENNICFPTTPRNNFTFLYGVRLYRLQSYDTFSVPAPPPSSESQGPPPPNATALSLEIIGAISGVVGLLFSGYEIFKCWRSTQKKRAKKDNASNNTPVVEWPQTAPSASTPNPISSNSTTTSSIKSFFAWESSSKTTAVSLAPPSVALPSLVSHPNGGTLFDWYFLWGHGAFFLLSLLLSIGFTSSPLVINCNDTPSLYVAGYSTNLTLFRILFFNGDPSFGQNVGLVIGTSLTTTVDPLGWNGAPFTFNDQEEFGELCPRSLTTYDNCLGLRNKTLAAFSPPVVSSMDPVPSPDVLLTLTSMSLGALSVAFVFTVIQSIPAIIKLDIFRMSSLFACIPFIAVSFSFACALVTTSPSSTLSPLTRKVIATINPVIIENCAKLWMSMGGLWFGGAQTIFGVFYQLEFFPIPDLMTQQCFVSNSSISYRVIGLAFMFISAIISVTFRAHFLKMLV